MFVIVVTPDPPLFLDLYTSLSLVLYIAIDGAYAENDLIFLGAMR